MANNKTTIAGGIAGLCMIGGAFYPPITPFCEPIGGLAMIAFAYFAADSRNITAWADDKSQTDKDGNSIPR